MTVSQIQLTRVRVVLEGLPPGVIFQGKGLMSADSNGKPKKPRPAEEEARLRAHWVKVSGKKKEQLCIPWPMLHLSFCQAANAFQWILPDGKKQKTFMGYMIGANVNSEVDRLSLGTDQFETKLDYCRIPPKKGGMVEIGRALVPKWTVEIPLVIDDELWRVEVLEEIIAHAGKAVGIGAWRPGLKGAYGKYRIKSFDVLD